MLVTSVVLVLEEVVEASLIIGTLMAVNTSAGISRFSLIVGVCFGLFLAFAYGSNMQSISEWFDYVGQEVVNAFLQIAASISIICYCRYIFHYRTKRKLCFSGIFAAAIAAFALALEGAEIWIYMSSLSQRSDNNFSVVMGANIGGGIGLGIGVLLYYGLSELNDQYQKITAVILLGFFSGNFLSKTVVALTQADWIAASTQVWDSSEVISEYSLAGQLLYALIGYEATPSFTQLYAYLFGITSVVLISVVKIRLKEKVSK